MIPEAELIRREFVIREMDFPENINLTKKSLLRWCCLSLGLISKNESRDKAFAVFDVLFTFLFTKKKNPTTIEIQEELKTKYNIITSEKLIRYHLNRLINLGLIVRNGIVYKINPSPSSEKRNSLAESYKAWVETIVVKELEKNFVALEKLQEAYK